MLNTAAAERSAPWCKCVDGKKGAARLARLLGAVVVDELLDGAAGEAPAASDAADDYGAASLSGEASKRVGGRAEQRRDLFRVEPRVRAVTVRDGIRCVV